MTPMLRIPLSLLATTLAAPCLLVLAPTAASSQPARATTTVTSEAQLREAVERANGSRGEDTIRLGRDLVLRRGALEVTDALVLDGDGHALVARSGDRLLDVTVDGSLRLVDATLRGGRAPEGESGGAIRATGASVEVVDSRLVGNRVSGEGASGGAILNDGGTVTVTGSRLERNRAERAGGGIEANAGSTTVTDSLLRGNRTGAGPGNGGGLHLTGMAQVTYDGGTVSGNRAAAQGGGLWNSDTGFLTVTGVDVSGNQAPEGADVYNDGGLFLQDGLPVLPSSLGLPALPGLPLT